MKIQQIQDKFSEYIVMKDPYALQVILGTIIGNGLLPNDPLWVMLVAQSSGGKSTLIAPCAGIQSVYFVDDLTEKTFLSGYKAKGKEMSLLKVIGSGVLCFSDFTSILSKNPVSRGEILGQLRLIYDGTFMKRTGSSEVSWRGKMGFLAAATPDIYYMLEQNRSMGERFLYYSLTTPSDQEIVDKQSQVKTSGREIQEELKPYYSEYIEGVRGFVLKNGLPDFHMTDELTNAVNDAAMFCVSAKATVHLDFKTGRPDALVNKPGVGRDRRMFQTLLKALHLMRCYELDQTDLPPTPDMVAVVEKCAYSSIGPERRKILEILSQYDQPMTASEIGATDDFGLQKEGVEKYLYVLHAVGLVQKETSGNAFSWYIKSQKEKDFIRKVSGVTQKSMLAPEIMAENQTLLDEFDKV